VTAASLIGFGVVFLLVCGVTSGLVTLWLLARRHVHAARGAAVERRAAELAATLPVVLGIAVVAILALESVTGIDHCDVHGHHAHLCLWHGAIWLDRAGAVAALFAGAVVVAVRGGALALGMARARSMVARLRVAGTRRQRVHVVQSDRVFCFVAGLVRPTIFASSAARAALAPDEWEAMLAHEASHVRHHDLRRRLRLELLLLFAAPLTAIAIRERWDLATERLRDADAADAVGSSETVASALVRMARRAAEHRLAGVAAFTPQGDQVLTARVASLLDAAPRGDAAARHLGWRSLGFAAGLVILALVLADPLHHALETLLG
jgi:Zn-dependent protease with chaperone function